MFLKDSHYDFNFIVFFFFTSITMEYYFVIEKHKAIINKLMITVMIVLVVMLMRMQIEDKKNQPLLVFEFESRLEYKTFKNYEKKWRENF